MYAARAGKRPRLEFEPLVEVRLVLDSPLEGDGYEPLVPRRTVNSQGPTSGPATMIAADDRILSEVKMRDEGLQFLARHRCDSG